MLPDGRFFIGHIYSINTAIYDPATGTWTAGPLKGSSSSSSEERDIPYFRPVCSDTVFCCSCTILSSSSLKLRLSQFVLYCLSNAGSIGLFQVGSPLCTGSLPESIKAARIPAARPTFLSVCSH